MANRHLSWSRPISAQDPQIETALIVDDDRINRTVTAEILSPDFRVLLARDGHSALEILAHETVSMVLLDVSMPGMSGYDVLIEMKKSPRLAQIPVIFITGMSEETDEEYGLLLGAADYVQKPVRPAILRARVRTQLNLLSQRRTLEALVMRDGLTGIINRRGFDDAFASAFQYVQVHHKSLGLAIFDVDHFKQYNDFYGHAAGDTVLCKVASFLSAALSETGDVLARYGGEEFVFFTLRPEGLAQMMEQARQYVQSQAIAHLGAPTTHGVLTLSGGGTIWHPGQNKDPSHLLKQADDMLYQAKANGRNQICLWGG